MKTKSSIQDICVVGPFPPPVHGASLLAKYLSTHLFAIEIKSNITNQKLKITLIMKNIFILFYSLFNLSSKKVLVFTASELPGKVRDLFIIMILLIRKRDLYVCIHNNPFYSNDILGAIHTHLANYYTMIFSYRSAEFEKCLERGLSPKVIKNSIPEESEINYFISQRQVTKSNLNKPVKFLICANPHPFKNIQFTIDALRKLKMDWTLDVLGSLESQFAINLKENNKDNNIKFHGVVQGYQKFKMLDECDILLHLSTNEEFPLVQLEALLMEIPFISISGVGGLYKELPRHIREKYFYSIDKIIDGSLEDIIKTLRFDNSIIKEAKQFYLDNYSSDKMINNYYELLGYTSTDKTGFVK